MSNNITFKTVDGEINTKQPIAIKNHLCFKTGIEVHNFSTKPFWCVMSNGIAMEVRPSNNRVGDDKIIVTHCASNNTGGSIIVPEGHEDKKVEHLRGLLTSNLNYRYEETLPVDDIFKERNGLYHASSNIMFYTDASTLAAYGHPLSRQQTFINYLKQGGSIDSRYDLAFNVVLVDNSNQYSHLYLVINDKVSIVKNHPNLALETGVYINGFPELNGNDNKFREAQRYVIDDALDGKAPIHFYKTLEEANLSVITVKNKFTEHEFNEIKRKHEKEIEILKQERIQMEHRTTTFEVQEKTKNLKEEKRYSRKKNKNDYELTALKAEYEKRSLENKKQNEQLKTYGLLLSGVIMLWKLFT